MIEWWRRSLSHSFTSTKWWEQHAVIVSVYFWPIGEMVWWKSVRDMDHRLIVINTTINDQRDYGHVIVSTIKSINHYELKLWDNDSFTIPSYSFPQHCWSLSLTISNSLYHRYHFMTLTFTTSCSPCLALSCPYYHSAPPSNRTLSSLTVIPGICLSQLTSGTWQ